MPEFRHIAAFWVVFGFIVLIVCAGATSARLPPPAREEVMTLLSRLEGSKCQFNRNGTWYSGAEAKAHLVQKLEYMGENFFACHDGSVHRIGGNNEQLIG